MLTNGLFEKIYSAFLQGTRHDVVVAVAGDDNNRQIHLPVLHDFHESEAADDWKMQVEDQTRSRAGLMSAEKGRRTIEFTHRQAVAFEKHLQRIPDCRVVVDDVDDIVVRVAHDIGSTGGSVDFAEATAT